MVVSTPSHSDAFIIAPNEVLSNAPSVSEKHLGLFPSVLSHSEFKLELRQIGFSADIVPCMAVH